MKRNFFFKKKKNGGKKNWRAVTGDINVRKGKERDGEWKLIIIIINSRSLNLSHN